MEEALQDLKQRSSNHVMVPEQRKWASANVLWPYLFDDTAVNNSADFLCGCSTGQQRHVVAAADGRRQSPQEPLVETLQVHSYVFNRKPEKAELFDVARSRCGHLRVVRRRDLIKDKRLCLLKGKAEG